MSRTRHILLSALGAGLMGVSLITPASADAPDGPVVRDGQTQPVFADTPLVRQTVHVPVPTDSDRDGSSDEVELRIVRPQGASNIPSVVTLSPYWAGGNAITNHDVDVPLWYPGRDSAGRDALAAREAGATAPAGLAAASERVSYPQYFLDRGFAYIQADSLGTGGSTGCPTTGAANETAAGKAVVDFLAGRVPGTTDDGRTIRPDWSMGKVAMMGVSYNGTLPNMVATTGVRGLEAIVPISAISDWYRYYRNQGAVLAPEGYQGEDTDVLAEYVLTRDNPEICRPVIEELQQQQDRLTGDRSAFWDKRDYLSKAGSVHAAALVVHGLRDYNVKPQQADDWYRALNRHGVPSKLWWLRGKHGGPGADRQAEFATTMNRWFTRYLLDVRNGVEDEPPVSIERSDGTPVDAASWPVPGSQQARLHPGTGGRAAGTLGLGRESTLREHESLIDDASITAEDLAAAPRSKHRLRYLTDRLQQPVHVSGAASLRMRVAVDARAANLTALLVDYAPDGSQRIISRGWADPQNRFGEHLTVPVRAGDAMSVRIRMQPQDYIMQAGHRMGLVLASSDHDFTLRPPPGRRLTVTLGATELAVPVVGGSDALNAAGAG